MIMTDQEKAIEAVYLLNTKIVIHTDADLTPKGKRGARVVETRTAMGKGHQLRWYVGGRCWRGMSPTPENITLTNEWMAS